MRVNSSFSDWKEARRFRGLELVQEGWSQQDVAEALGVSQGAVSQWVNATDLIGPQALLARPHTGAPPRLSPVQREQLLAYLAQGAEAYGFRGAVWTCARVGVVIEQEFGVQYHKAHVARLLKALNWTPQKPVRRALQQDPLAIEHWRTQEWPRLKRGRCASTNCPSLLTKPELISCRRPSEPTPRAD
jgi:transposase